jgi:deoxyribodipyrimidine photo-lyase
MKTKIVVHWFRRDLRLADNTALYHASQSGHPVLPIFIFDQHILNALDNRKDARVGFIHQTLQSMHETLQSKGKGIHFFFDTPEKVWRHLIEEYDIQGVFFNRDYEPYARERDRMIHDILQAHSIPLHTFKDHVLFEKKEVCKDDGKPYTVFTPYSRKWKSLLKPEMLEATPEVDWETFIDRSKSNIPTLEEMNFSPSEQVIPSSSIDLDIVRQYHETRDIPSVRGTTRLSLHLRFGTISIRACVKVGLENNEKWLNELIWRDFYQMIVYCFPHSVQSSFKPQYDRIEWRHDEGDFQKWCEGNTGYPIVDAGMRELNETGFMHNRVRMIVASFFTKHLLLDWRWGERYFAEKLLDYEMASNVGGWQWAAGSGCDAAPYFRIFNPYSQTEKFDAQHQYIQRWVPEWKTISYPKPMVDHAQARERCLSVYKAALTAPL